MKTLKREEIYANDYQDLKDLLGNIEAFIKAEPQSVPFTLGAGLSAAGRVPARGEYRSEFCWSNHEFFQA